MYMLVKAVLWTSASLCVLAQASLVVAQTTNAPAGVNPDQGALTPAVPSQQPAGPDGTTPAATQGNLEEIVVTAQRRSQNLQQVPIAITAITGQTAARIGIIGTESIKFASPGVEFGRNAGNGGTPYVRGIGSDSGSIGAESPVALYIDDVYIGAPAGNILAFNNIDQVEVLKGPQGTLFGRNATGGVIQIRTLAPSQKERVDASVSYGNYNTVDGNLYVNGGLTDTLSANFAAQGHKQFDGYGRNLVTGDDIYKEWNYGFRGSLLWEPSTDTKMRLIADYSRQYSQLGLNPTINPGTVSFGQGTYNGKYTSVATSPDYGYSKQYGVSLRIDQSLGFAKLVTISAYRHTSLFNLFDQDGGPPALVLSSTSGLTNTVSQELQLQSQKGGRFTWLAGFYYFYNKGGYDPLRAISPMATGTAAFSDVNDRETLNSYAGFGEVNWELLPDTTITGGLRYTSDHYGISVRRTNALGAVTTGGIFDQSQTFSKLTYRGILNHKFSRDVMAYVSYSRGFKSGGYNVASPGVAPGNAPVEPEILDAYEIGLKSELFDRKVRINLAGFHYNYSNLQVTVVGPSTSFVVNAASARINGVDIDTTFAPTSRFQVNVAATFLDGHYRDFPNGPLFVPRPATCTPAPTRLPGALTGGNVQCAADLSGNRTVRTPKFTGSANASYTLPTEIGDFILSGNVYHNSGFFFAADNRTTQRRYNLVNATLTWRSSSNKFELGAYVKNLSNAYYATYGSESTLRDSQSPAAPRTFGVTAGVHF
jgi:iron complex outermembrane receptor protein